MDLEHRLRTTFCSLFSVSGEEVFETKAPNDRALSTVAFIDTTAAYRCAVSNLSAIDELPIPPTNPTTGMVEDVDQDLCLRRAMANLEKNTVSLSHTTIVEQIRERTVRAGSTCITTTSMQAMVFLRCLQVFCDDYSQHDPQTVNTARRYCGHFLPEHLKRVMPAEVKSSTRIEIAKRLVKLLRNTEITQRWLEFAEGYMSGDLLGSQFSVNTSYCGWGMKKSSLTLMESNCGGSEAPWNFRWSCSSKTWQQQLLIGGLHNKRSPRGAVRLRIVLLF